jgi:hypothetical protein
MRSIQGASAGRTGCSLNVANGGLSDRQSKHLPWLGGKRGLLDDLTICCYYYRAILPAVRE